MPQNLLNLEVQLFAKTLTVGELSDYNCRKILRRIVTRHGNGLLQLETTLRHDEMLIPKLNVAVKNPSQSLQEK